MSKRIFNNRPKKKVKKTKPVDFKLDYGGYGNYEDYSLDENDYEYDVRKESGEYDWVWDN